MFTSLIDVTSDFEHKSQYVSQCSVRLCVYVCVLVFLSCEITSETEMIVVTGASVSCEIDLTIVLQPSFLFSVLSELGLG